MTPGLVKLLKGGALRLSATSKEALKNVDPEINLERYNLGPIRLPSVEDALVWSPFADAVLPCPDLTDDEGNPWYYSVDSMKIPVAGFLSANEIEKTWDDLLGLTENLVKKIVVIYPTTRLGLGPRKERIDSIQSLAGKKFAAAGWMTVIPENSHLPLEGDLYWAHYSRAVVRRCIEQALTIAGVPFNPNPIPSPSIPE